MPKDYASLINLNGNLLCSIGTIVTGSRPGYSDLIEVCILPLNSHLEVIRTITPFYAQLKPKRPENCLPDETKVSRDTLNNAILKGLDPYAAVDLFESWWTKLNLGYDKRIAPLTHDYLKVNRFLTDWLGEEHMHQLFDARYRDTMSAATFCNDMADFGMESCPFPKVKFKFLCSQLKISCERTQDSLSMALIISELYRQIIKQSL